MRVRCGRDLGEIRARRSRGEIAGELANEIQTRSRRDSPAALPLRRSAGGESTGSADPNSPSGAGSSGGSRTATGARQRSAGKKKRGGVSLAPSEPHAPRHRGTALLPPLDDVCDYRAAHVDPDPAVGVGPVRERRHEQPPLGAPAVRSERLRRGEGGRGDERCTRGQQRREESGVPAPRPQCLGTRGARRSGSASSRSWA